MNPQSAMNDGATPGWVLYEFSDAKLLEHWNLICSDARLVEAWPADLRARAIALKRAENPNVGRSDRRQERGTAYLDSLPAAVEWPAPLDLAALAEHEPVAPRFIVPDWLPCGYATLMSGHGGVGKSAIALHLAVCMALGGSWAGLACEPRRVLYLSCEDRAGVLHWRLERICRLLEVGLASLVERLDIVELVGHDAILWERDPKSGNCYTPAYGRLQERVLGSGAEVIVVDGISDTYGGNENVRSEVKRYVNSLVALAPADTGAVLLIGHVAKPQATDSQSGEGYSGSTAWHNSVRSRWYLYDEKQQGDDGGRAQKTGALNLELQKSNLGRTDQSIKWRWDDGAHLFVPEAAPTAFDRKHQDRAEQAALRHALKSCMDAGHPVPAAMTGQRTTYLVLSQRAEFPDSLKGATAHKKQRFRRHFEVLRQMRHIEESSYRRANGHRTASFVLTTEGIAECAEC